MTVLVGDIITASQYNVLKDGINKWFGDVYSSNTPASLKATSSYGWGNTNAAAKAIGNIVTAEDSNHLINRLNLGVAQTGSGSTSTKVVVGNTILASEHNNIETQSAAIDAGRLTSIDHTITSGGNDGNSARSSWSSAISVTVTATFSSYAKARYYFNSGGQLRYSFNCSGTSDDALAWDDLFDADDMGSLIFSYENISQTGTRPGNAFSDSGFYELTTTPTEIYNINLDEAPYTANDLKVMASRNADGTQVILTFTLNNDDPQAELVDGTTTIYLDNRKADNKDGTIPTTNFAISAPTTHSAAAWSGS